MQGSCLCGAVTFKVTGPVTSATACHCGQCRKQSGHVWAAANCAISDIAIAGDVTWFRSSEKVRRGFCPVCGSALFWHVIGKDEISFALGAVDGPTGLHLERHIFTADKGDYYDIADGLPQL